MAFKRHPEQPFIEALDKPTINAYAAACKSQGRLSAPASPNA